MQKMIKAALYIRLSKEDDHDGPSESVTNQREILQAYAQQQHFRVHDIYIDDGYSGCSFDRPAFLRMLQDIESGKVNTVITKDLSRLGRDYILTGHYLERYFPEHGVRYISLLDGIDTQDNCAANDITPFRAIMNDMYAKDISRKITSVKRNKQQRGQFIGSKAPYGYRKHPADKNKLIIDEDAAMIVRRIFSLALSNASCREIADILNSEQIPPPSVYAQLQTSGTWSGERIGEMLKNETYLGNMVQGRRVKISYKSRKSQRRGRDDWIVVRQTHEPIISEETFEAVQQLLASRSRTRRRTHDSPLKGIIFCHECGQPLGLVNRKNASGKDTLYFICRTYRRSAAARQCSAHCQKAEYVEEAVFSALRRIIESETSKEELISFAREIITEQNRQVRQKQDTSFDARFAHLNRQIDRLHLDLTNGLILQTDFDRIYRALCLQREQLKTELSPSRQKSENIAFPTAEAIAADFMDTLTGNRDLLSSLIEKIELKETKEILLHFRFRKSSRYVGEKVSY